MAHLIVCGCTAGSLSTGTACEPQPPDGGIEAEPITQTYPKRELHRAFGLAAAHGPLIP
jgi:hypothetical protein